MKISVVFGMLLGQGVNEPTPLTIEKQWASLNFIRVCKSYIPESWVYFRTRCPHCWQSPPCTSGPEHRCVSCSWRLLPVWTDPRKTSDNLIWLKIYRLDDIEIHWKLWVWRRYLLWRSTQRRLYLDILVYCELHMSHKE